MQGKKLYSDVRFVKIENLKGRAKEVAENLSLKEGLAILKVSINSIPEYEIIPVVGDPLIALKNLASEDGISPQQLDEAFKEAFEQ